jgi:hypothetical protein
MDCGISEQAIKRELSSPTPPMECHKKLKTKQIPNEESDPAASQIAAFLEDSDDDDIKGLDHHGSQDSCLVNTKTELVVYDSEYQNLPLSEEQMEIINHAMEHNVLAIQSSLVSRMFIAATIIKNYLTRSSQGKILFVGKSKVNSQLFELCTTALNIPVDLIVEVTDSNTEEERKGFCKSKRVLLLDPREFYYDIKNGYCPESEVNGIMMNDPRFPYWRNKTALAILDRNNAEYRLLVLIPYPPFANNIRDLLYDFDIDLLEPSNLSFGKHNQPTDLRSIERQIVPQSPEILKLSRLIENVLEPYVDQLSSKGLMYYTRFAISEPESLQS